MKGFVALTSVIIIAAVLMLVVVTAGTPIFYAHMNLLEREWSTESALLAESCKEEVTLRKITEPGYASSTIPIEDSLCTVSTSSVHIEYHGSVTVLPF